MDFINELHELCDSLSTELHDVNEKIRSAGKMSPGDLEVVDKLTHSLKSIKAVIAMMDDEYSGRSYDDGMSRNRSYARRRDAMGRYSGRMYSRGGDLAAQLHDLMQEAPNDSVRREMQRLVDKLEM